MLNLIRNRILILLLFVCFNHFCSPAEAFCSFMQCCISALVSNLDPAFSLNVDPNPDPASQTNADPHPDHVQTCCQKSWIRIRIKKDSWIWTYMSTAKSYHKYCSVADPKCFSRIRIFPPWIPDPWSK
jgi:hypothetical protein